MRIFHELVFEGYIGGNLGVWSPNQFNELLGSVDSLSVSGEFTQLSGSSLQFSCLVADSGDNLSWINRGNAGIFTAASPDWPLFQMVDYDPDDNRKLGYVRLLLILDGTDARGYIKVYATGRDYSRRAARRQAAPAQGNGTQPPAMPGNRMMR